MKNLTKVFVLSSVLMMTFSCSSHNSNKIAYFQSVDGKIAIIDSANGRGTNSDLIKMMNMKKSFIFYITDSGCTSCRSFERMLETYLQNNPLLIYSIDISTYNSMPFSTRNSLGLPGSTVTPTIFFIKSGKVINYTSYDKATFTSADKFDSMIERYGVKTELKYSLSKNGDSYAEETDDSYPEFDSSFSGNVIYYETITTSIDSLLIKNSNDYYVYDLSAQITTTDYTSIDENKFENYLANHNISSQTKITLPFLANYESGTVTSVTNL